MSIAYLHRHSAHHHPLARYSRLLSVTTRACTRGSSQRLVVSVHGEVDSSNAKQFAVAVCDAAANCGALILDLTGLQFIAVDGFAALHAINAAMARTDSSWQVAPSPAVLRLLGLCDPEGLIPLASPEDVTYVRNQQVLAQEAETA